MASKLQEYRRMSEEAQRQLTGSLERWQSFLATASRLYKYPYHEQVMIHAQRPDATACAEFDVWNNTMRRYVRRGSKGIALIDTSGDRERLRYVFDVSDTGTRPNSRSLNLWELREEHIPTVSSMLEKNYGVPAGESLAAQLEDVASQLAREYWEDNRRDMVQGLVNSFGPIVMAAFAAAVKIDAFAYMPVQDFGNAFSTFIAQNYGAKESERIREGLKSAVCISMAFCVVISALVFVFARPLMAIFVDAGETEVILEGVRYLRIEGAFYCGIGCLFLLYGLYRALGRPGMSVVLTVVSLGTRVALAYLLSAIPAIGVIGIWWSVPIGWALADLTGLFYYKARKKELLA